MADAQSDAGITKCCAAALFAALLSACSGAFAFESDVHFGLTQWLALQAGFTSQQAEIIAIGNNRVDSGDMQYIDVLFGYGCLDRDDEAAQSVSAHHFPTDGKVPGPPEQRFVAPGSLAAQRAADDITKKPIQLSPSLLYKLGEGLHALQDSWSHQGVPDTPQVPGNLFECDSTRAWAHPRARGGWNSHQADQTTYWPGDTLAMAKATFDVLTRYPNIMGEARSPKSWGSIQPMLDRFIKASTKSEKKAWFISQGIVDASFLGDTTLKDGAPRFDDRWSQRKLPKLTNVQSRQHYIDQDILDFYNEFFAQWMTTDDFDGLAARVVAAPAAREKHDTSPPFSMDKAALVAHLKLWRMRDHGRAAEFAHAPLPLTAKQRAAVNSLGKAAYAYVRYESPSEAFFPLQPNGKDASPLLPFIVGEAKPSSDGNRRVVATAKFRHAPYDIVGVVSEKIGGQWKVVSIVSAVDH
jgi:hypothetical protein